MRETVALIAVVAIFLGLMAWFRPSLGPKFPKPVAKRGEIYGPTGPAKMQLVRKNKPTQDQTAIPSLYSVSRKSKSKPKQKIVHGVALEDFVEKKQNSLRDSAPVADVGGMRVFFQCMELKKGQTSQLTEKECKELGAVNPRRGSPLIQ